MGTNSHHAEHPAYFYVRCTIFRCDNGCVKFLVEAISDVRDRLRDVMIVVNLLDQIMMNFPKSPLEVN